MRSQINNKLPDLLETLSTEFNEHNVYGLEYILDEFEDNKEDIKPKYDDPANTDWFGFSDLCI